MRQPVEPSQEGPDKACATLGGSRLNFFAALGVLTDYFFVLKKRRKTFF
jgi:hypothetical protein